MLWAALVGKSKVLGWRWKSGRGLPQSRTLSRGLEPTSFAPAFGLRQSSGAFADKQAVKDHFIHSKPPDDNFLLINLPLACRYL